MKRFALPLFFIVPLLFFLSAADLSAQPRKVFVVTLEDDIINPVTSEYIASAIERASREQAEALVINLDTPGGLLTSTRTVVKAILTSRVPVVVYVAPSGSRAGSAGVFITYASHVAAMAPATNIGAAHPVSVGGGERRQRNVWDAVRDLLDKVREEDGEENDREEEESPEEVTPESPLEDKIVNDTIAFIRAMAAQRGRNVEWAEKSVVESASITETEALELGVVELIAASEKDLLERMDGMTVEINGREVTLRTREAEVEHIGMDFRQRFLNVLANPNIAYMLLMLGFYALLFEVTNPGLGVPGVIGTVFIILALFSMQTLPTNYAGLGLILLGLVLLGAEAFVPGFGLLTLGGVVCLSLGAVFLFDSTYELMQVSMSLIFGFTAATTVITLTLARLALKSFRFKKQTGMEGLQGAYGEAARDLEPGKEGKIFIHGEIWNAVAEGPIKKGEKVVVTKHENMLLYVEKA